MLFLLLPSVPQRYASQMENDIDLPMESNNPPKKGGGGGKGKMTLRGGLECLHETGGVFLSTEAKTASPGLRRVGRDTTRLHAQLLP